MEDGGVGCGGVVRREDDDVSDESFIGAGSVMAGDWGVGVWL